MKPNPTYTKLTLTDISGEEINANLYEEHADHILVKGDIIAIQYAKV